MYCARAISAPGLAATRVPGDHRFSRLRRFSFATLSKQLRNAVYVPWSQNLLDQDNPPTLFGRSDRHLAVLIFCFRALRLSTFSRRRRQRLSGRTSSQLPPSVLTWGALDSEEP